MIFNIMWSENYDGGTTWNILYTGTINDHHCFPEYSLYCFVYLYTWKVILGSWSADSNMNWQIWHRREARLPGQGWHQGTLRFPLCPPAWFCLTTCSILTRNQPPCTQREDRERDESHGIVISDLTMSPRVVISLIRPGQHWGGVRTRAETSLVTRSEAGYFNICKSILSTKVNV